MNINLQSAHFHTQPDSDDRAEVCPDISLCFVIFTIKENELNVLCKEPSGEQPTLPGGRVFADQGIRKSAKTCLKDLVDTAEVFHEQLQTFGGSGLKPLTVAYYALLPTAVDANEPSAQNDFCWRSMAKLPKFRAEEHSLIDFAIRILRQRASCEPVVFELLPVKFTLLQFQQVYETIFNVHMAKSNFRRRVAKMKYVVPSQEWQEKVAHRAARLYEFNASIYREISCKEFSDVF